MTSRRPHATLRLHVTLHRRFHRQRTYAHCPGQQRAENNTSHPYRDRLLIPLPPPQNTATTRRTSTVAARPAAYRYRPPHIAQPPSAYAQCPSPTAFRYQLTHVQHKYHRYCLQRSGHATTTTATTTSSFTPHIRTTILSYYLLHHHQSRYTSTAITTVPNFTGCATLQGDRGLIGRLSDKGMGAEFPTHPSLLRPKILLFLITLDLFFVSFFKSNCFCAEVCA